MARHPKVSVQLQLSVTPPPLTDETFDICIRFGEPPDARVIAHTLAPNRRVLCAAPAYLARHGAPNVPRDLTKHNCISIRQGDEPYGVWQPSSSRGTPARNETIRVRGNLTTNDGEVALRWALDGHGILLRSEWDVREYLADGRLVAVLSDYKTPSADIYAVYAQRHQLSVRIRAFVDFLAEAFSGTAR